MMHALLYFNLIIVIKRVDASISLVFYGIRVICIPLSLVEVFFSKLFCPLESQSILNSSMKNILPPGDLRHS